MPSVEFVGGGAESDSALFFVGVRSSDPFFLRVIIASWVNFPLIKLDHYVRVSNSDSWKIDPLASSSD